MAKQGSFTAAGQLAGGTTGFIKGIDPINVSLIGGAGTFAPQWFVSNQWQDIKTLPASDVTDAFVNVAIGTRVRVKCVTYTSGPVAWEIG